MSLTSRHVQEKCLDALPVAELETQCSKRLIEQEPACRRSGRSCVDIEADLERRDGSSREVGGAARERPHLRRGGGREAVAAAAPFPSERFHHLRRRGESSAETRPGSADSDVQNEPRALASAACTSLRLRGARVVVAACSGVEHPRPTCKRSAFGEGRFQRCLRRDADVMSALPHDFSPGAPFERRSGGARALLGKPCCFWRCLEAASSPLERRSGAVALCSLDGAARSTRRRRARREDGCGCLSCGCGPFVQPEHHGLNRTLHQAWSAFWANSGRGADRGLAHQVRLRLIGQARARGPALPIGLGDGSPLPSPGRLSTLLQAPRKGDSHALGGRTDMRSRLGPVAERPRGSPPLGDELRGAPRSQRDEVGPLVFCTSCTCKRSSHASAPAATSPLDGNKALPFGGPSRVIFVAGDECRHRGLCSDRAMRALHDWDAAEGPHSYCAVQARSDEHGAHEQHLRASPKVRWSLRPGWTRSGFHHHFTCATEAGASDRIRVRSVVHDILSNANRALGM